MRLLFNLVQRIIRDYTLFIILSCVFFFEGLGIVYGREISYFIILFFPFFLFMPYWRVDRIMIPKKISMAFFLFLILSSLSVVFSLNVQRSFEYLLLYISSFMVFIYGYNFKKKVTSVLIPFLFLLAILFSLYSMIVPYLINKKLILFTPTHGYQFVYSLFGSHNHLGDLLLLPILICVFYVLLENKKKILWFLFLLFILPFFIFSYSRSSYFDFVVLVVILIMYFLKHKKAHLLSFTSLGVRLLVVLALFSFLITTSDIGSQPLFRNLRSIFAEKQHLENKEFVAQRNSFYSSALTAMVQYPFFGVGPGNFFYVSLQYANGLEHLTYSAHNLFLDIFSEQGILAGLAFLSIILLILKNSKKNLYFLLFLALLLNFQTDYTYRIYSLFFLFMIVAGSIYQEHQDIKINWFPSGSFIFAFVTILILLSSIAVNFRRYELARLFYPLNQYVYKPLIAQEGNKQKTIQFLNAYAALFKGDYFAQRFIGETYEKYKMDQKALIHYENAYKYSFFSDFSTVEKILELKKQKSKEYKEFTEHLFMRQSTILNKDSIPYEFRISTMKLCQKVYNLHCPYDL